MRGSLCVEIVVCSSHKGRFAKDELRVSDSDSSLELLLLLEDLVCEIQRR